MNDKERNEFPWEVLMKRIVASMICVIGWMGLSGLASAQEPGCADLKWGDWVTERPYMPASCAGVVEKNGILYAKFNAKMERYFNNGDVKLRIFAPDGTWNVDTFRPPADFRADVDGQPTPFSQIPTGKDIRVYVPEGRFTLVSFDQEVVVEAVPVEEPVEEVVVAEEVVMPTTASPLPLIGLAGGLFVMLGGLAAFLRRRA
jgi:hypothetical protein